MAKTILSADCLLGLGFVASCAGTQIAKDRISDPGEMLFNGQAVSGIDCYKCHNGDGKGTWRGPNLAELVPKLSDKAIAVAIHEGPGMMPSYQGKIDDQQIAQITAWLRSRFPGGTPQLARASAKASAGRAARRKSVRPDRGSCAGVPIFE